MSVLKDVSDAIPEAFYEIAVYFPPMIYLCVAISLIFEFDTKILIAHLPGFGKWPEGIFSTILLVVGLFVVGQVFNTLAHHCWRFKKASRASEDEHENRWRRVRSKPDSPASHMSKIRAKRVLSHSMYVASVALLLMFVIATLLVSFSPFSVKPGVSAWKSSFLIAGFGIAAFLDARKRRDDEKNLLDILDPK